ncbi:acyl-CoA dehydrogenase, middle domain protein [Teladorsagia circumcincta]|uniref:Acyl-CoA dehydrogenase, middle domain protein n=1 Tax=Teladorsagia circumcincta TaxID=45464 RepID=A0A2G9V2Z1_TELCI|nr:acyl-CoA dehydrogenase, middle domain protein [Teladorsagia circumcincta]
MAKWDKEEYFPVETMRHAGELGFGAIYCSDEFGGSGMSRLHASVIYEQLAAGCVSTATYMSIHNMCAWMIDTYGSKELREKHIPTMATFENLSSYCLTEPDSGRKCLVNGHADSLFVPTKYCPGSDAASLRTTARREGDYYVVNGSKAFISGAGASKIYLVMVRHDGQPGAKGIFCLLIEDGMEGFSQAKKESKLGWNTQPTRIITFEDVKVPVTNQIGPDNYGFNIAMAGINGGRVNIASCSLGAAQQSLDLAIEHLKVRKQFGKRLSDFQWNQFKLAEMATKLHSSRSSVTNYLIAGGNSCGAALRHKSVAAFRYLLLAGSPRNKEWLLNAVEKVVLSYRITPLLLGVKDEVPEAVAYVFEPPTQAFETNLLEGPFQQVISGSTWMQQLPIRAVHNNTNFRRKEALNWVKNSLMTKSSENETK